MLRLHDPGRKPQDWTEIIRPGQFAAFAKEDVAGAPCDPEGQRFVTSEEATCAVFDSVDEARDYCERAVDAHPGVRFDVFDAEGRTKPALFVVVHPSLAATLETAPGQVRRRRWIAWVLIAAAIPLLVYAYVQETGDRIILPAFIGINMVLIGLRLLWVNMSLRETERTREERLAQALRPGSGQAHRSRIDGA